MKIRTLTMDDVVFELTLEDEDIPVRGNACATDEPEEDKKTEDWILGELDRGNLAAWCCAKVTARFGRFAGSTYLGGCSYRTEGELRADLLSDEYGLRADALADLNATIASLADGLPVEE